MKEQTLKDLKEEYYIDFEKTIKEINAPEVKLILLQFPDGLKPYATAVTDYLKEKTKKEFLIYLGNCFGACDTPQGFENLKIDLTIQFGHTGLQPNYLK